MNERRRLGDICSFLLLPTEIRFLIYRAMFEDPALDLVPLLRPPRGRRKSIPIELASSKLAILLTCRKIYAECRNFAYANTVFHVLEDFSQSPKFIGDHNGSRLLRHETRALIRFATVLGNSSAPFRLNLPNLEYLGVRESLDPCSIQPFLREMVIKYPRMRKLIVVADMKECGISDCDGTCEHSLSRSVHGSNVRGNQALEAETEEFNYNFRRLVNGIGRYIVSGLYCNHVRVVDADSRTGCLGLACHSTDLGRGFRDEHDNPVFRHIHVMMAPRKDLRRSVSRYWYNDCPRDYPINGDRNLEELCIAKDITCW